MGQPTFFFYMILKYLILVASSEDAEQIEEEVDEVEIKTQGSNECKLLCTLACIGSCLAHLLDLLGVVSGETNEYEHANVAQYEVETTACHEHIDY